MHYGLWARHNWHHNDHVVKYVTVQDTWYWEITFLQGTTKPTSFLQAITLEDSAVAEVEIFSNCTQLPPARHRTPRVSWNLPWRPLKKVLDELTVLEVCGTWNTCGTSELLMMIAFLGQQTLLYTRLCHRIHILRSQFEGSNDQKQLASEHIRAASWRVDT